MRRLPDDRNHCGTDHWRSVSDWSCRIQPANARKTGESIRVAQAVTDTKLEELAREVREHNNYAKRMPVVEEKIKVINHRLEDLEEFHKG